MGSRIRENVKHFFECFCEVVPKSEERDAWIIQKYPDSYKDLDLLKSVPKFAYPCQFENNIVQHYSFVLTDIESKWTFGFCRHDPKTETALVVLSYLPWHQAFYKFLNNIAILIHSPRSEDIRDFLQAAYNKKVPESGTVFIVPFNKGESTFTCECPDQYKLPSIPENRNLTEYYNAVDTTNMMLIFAAMLNERRIIFTSRKLYRLSACVQSANDIIYPMIWQHIFIPVLPTALVDYLLAPMPFLIGVPYDVLKTVHLPEIGDVVILDADANKVKTPFDDLNSLPPEIVSSLKRQLRNRSTLLGDGVSRAFLRSLVQLIGGYRDALNMQEHKEITFNRQAFIESRPYTMQPFLEKMLELQIFQQFIEERLEMLNKGLGFTDEFEMEAHHYSEKSSSKLKQQYKEWTYTMKKEGTAFFKHVKDKANPAVKSAVKSVKESSKGMKSAYKGLRSKFKDAQGTEDLNRGMKTYADSGDKPRSAPNSPTGKRRNMTSFGVAKATYRKEGRNFMSANMDGPYSPLGPMSNLGTPESPDRSHSATPGLEIPQMDLLHEMQDLLLKHRLAPDVVDSPPIDRSLKPVRSLESFRNASSTSPDWAMSQSLRTRTGIPTSPTKSPRYQTHLFPNDYLDTPCLLQISDNYSGPPVPPRPIPPQDLFGSTPFVVGGGQNENGDAVFLVASENSVDMVKLSPPCAFSPRRSKREDKCEDLIRLDSMTSPEIDDFDPLMSKDRSASLSSPEEPTQPVFTKGLMNPLYTYYVPSGSNSLVNGNAKPKLYENTLNDQDLLQEYGLDFKNFSIKMGTTNASTTSTNCDPFTVNKKQTQWTTFE